MSNRKPEDRIYFVKNQVPRMKEDPSGASDIFIAIKHGEGTYSPTTVFDQAHADELNRRQGISPGMAAAAHICSMFKTWDRFEQTTREMESLA